MSLHVSFVEKKPIVKCVFAEEMQLKHKLVEVLFVHLDPSVVQESL